MKHIIIILLTLPTIFVISGCSGSSEPEIVETKTPYIGFDPIQRRVKVDEIFSLNLRTNLITDTTFAISMRIILPAATIAFVDSLGFTPGTLFGDNGICFIKTEQIHARKSIIHLSFTCINDEIPNTNTDLLGIFTFQAFQKDTCKIQIDQDNLHFFNKKGLPMNPDDFSIHDVQITIN